MGRTLVAYFSATGNTKRAAEELAAVLGADMYEIKPQVPYTSKDLDWEDKNSRSSVEMNDEASRPQIQGSLPDLSGYDTVFIGFPVWWYTAPRIIQTFLDSCSISGKTMYPFGTSGTSGVEKGCEDLRRAYPQADWKNGKLLNRSITKDFVDYWME